MKGKGCVLRVLISATAAVSGSITTPPNNIWGVEYLNWLMAKGAGGGVSDHCGVHRIAGGRGDQGDEEVKLELR